MNLTDILKELNYDAEDENANDPPSSKVKMIKETKIKRQEDDSEQFKPTGSKA